MWVHSHQGRVFSDQLGIFLSFAGAVAAANPGLLKTLNQMETDEERMLFVSQLHKVEFIK